jgi:imidazole glycerol-phosphate synthase subunit HisH
VRVAVIDYGVGNIGSVLGALEELRVTSVLVTDPSALRQADRLILPGVGNFSDCAQILRERGWADALGEAVIGCSRPLLGICLGMQLLADSGTEGSADGGSAPGLGFIPGQVRHLRSFGSTLRVPHVGWNSVYQTAGEDPVLSRIPDRTDFFFVHSYAFAPQDPADVVALADYEGPFPAVVRRGHVWGTQFHPEKSSRAGLRVLQNFIEAPPAC